MMTPLLFLLAGQMTASVPRDQQTFAEMLEAANRAWYELSQTDTRFEMRRKGAPTVTMREVRDGERLWFRDEGRGIV